MSTSITSAESASETAAAESLLARLDFPRQNGTPGLQQAQAGLETALRAAGLEPATLPFACHPARADAAALALLCVAFLLGRAAFRPSRRWLAAAGLALAAALLAGAGDLDRLLPATTEAVLVTQVEPRGAPLRHVLLSAHYDSKTELLDHVGRGIVLGGAALGGAATALLVLRRRRRALRPLGVLTALAFAAAAAVLALGGLRQPSRGTVDNAAACALLVELAAATARQPLEHTRLTCVWFAGEENGAQGSAALAPRFAAERIDACINLEAIGAGSEAVVSRYELRRHGIEAASAAVHGQLERAAGSRLRHLPLPLWTDAGELLGAGVPALTLLTVEPGAWGIRHLHGPGDTPAHFVWAGYTRVRALLQRFLTLEAASIAPAGASRYPAANFASGGTAWPGRRSPSSTIAPAGPTRSPSSTAASAPPTCGRSAPTTRTWAS